MKNSDPPELYNRQFCLRMRPSTYDRLELVAHQDGRSVNRMADLLIREAIQARVDARLERARAKQEQKGQS